MPYPFEIMNRYADSVICTAHLPDALKDAARAVQLGEAIAMAVKDRANLTGAHLTFAHLAGANLRGANLHGAHLRCANLHGANLRGANLRGANLTGAHLTFAHLRDANLTGAHLADADLADADLTDADLTGAHLAGADLRGANLTGANLRGANLRDAYLAGANLRGATPLVPNLDAAILGAIAAGGTLNMTDWHTCNTTHCRAGWAVHLAGPDGYALEKRVGSATAGALIYARSAPDNPIPNFYASNEAAMADMRERAAKTTA